jgi:hypothetical protein
VGGIFISYRRDDSAPWAGRLYDLLAQKWGRDQVFMDVDAIEPGEDFRNAISRTLDGCDVVLLVIGPLWSSVSDAEGRSRLLDEGDVHRIEVESALARGVRLIPVLVGGASVPRKGDLPDSLGEIVYRNAAILDDRRFGADLESLHAVLLAVARTLEEQRVQDREQAEVERAALLAQQQAEAQAEQEAARLVAERAQQEAAERAQQEAAERAQQEAAERAQQEAVLQAPRHADAGAIARLADGDEGDRTNDEHKAVQPVSVAPLVASSPSRRTTLIAAGAVAAVAALVIALVAFRQRGGDDASGGPTTTAAGVSAAAPGDSSSDAGVGAATIAAAGGAATTAAAGGGGTGTFTPTTPDELAVSRAFQQLADPRLKSAERVIGFEDPGLATVAERVHAALEGQFAEPTFELTAINLDPGGDSATVTFDVLDGDLLVANARELDFIRSPTDASMWVVTTVSFCRLASEAGVTCPTGS